MRSSDLPTRWCKSYESAVVIRAAEELREQATPHLQVHHLRRTHSLWDEVQQLAWELIAADNAEEVELDAAQTVLLACAAGTGARER